MISKELLSEVLKDYTIGTYLYINDTFGYIQYINNSGVNKKINIYELVHICKEWANKKGFDVLSSCNSDGKVWVQLHEYDTKLIGSTEYFHSFSEIEAIFKACEWILNNKEKIK